MKELREPALDPCSKGWPRLIGGDNTQSRNSFEAHALQMLLLPVVWLETASRQEFGSQPAQEMRLEEYLEAASDWCAEMGAVSLEEIAENIEDSGRNLARSNGGQITWMCNLPTACRLQCLTWFFVMTYQCKGKSKTAGVQNSVPTHHGAWRFEDFGKDISLKPIERQRVQKWVPGLA